MGGCCNGSDSRLHRDSKGSIPLPPTTLGDVAQLVEQGLCKAKVARSSRVISIF